jgi:L-fucose dehydrogenase
MDLHLKDKIVLVTGGAKGIGEAICRTLIDEGGIPVIIDKDAKAGSLLKQQLGDRSLFIQKEITSAVACSQCVEFAVEKFGRIDGLVNNAGVNDGVGLEQGTPDRFIESLNNNVGHYYYFAHYALTYLKKSKGSIVNIGSKTAFTGQGKTSGYVAAKGAINSLTREWAVELLSSGVRVNAVIPAEVWTPLYETWLNSLPQPEKKLQSIVDKIPLENRMTTSKEIADMVVFLLSDRASHITGQWLHVDGGYVHLDRAVSN